MPKLLRIFKQISIHVLNNAKEQPAQKPDSNFVPNGSDPPTSEAAGKAK